MLGILVVDKPVGITSHDVVNRVRRMLGVKRVGHSGTLDPLATGVLVVAVGPATRFLQYLPLEPKVYVGTAIFGTEMDTQDAEGVAVSVHPVPEDLESHIQRVSPSFVGTVEQIPPMYSAVKRAGKPLYAYARAGVTVERESRVVYIKELDWTAFGSNKAEFRIACSGGTYVRTLVHDIGTAIGCGAYLGELRRTRVGDFNLERAASLESVTPRDLMPLAEALSNIPQIRVSIMDEGRIRQGQSIMDSAGLAGFVALLTQNGSVFAMGRADCNEIHPECVIPSEASIGSI